MLVADDGVSTKARRMRAGLVLAIVLLTHGAAWLCMRDGTLNRSGLQATTVEPLRNRSNQRRLNPVSVRIIPWISQRPAAGQYRTERATSRARIEPSERKMLPSVELDVSELMPGPLGDEFDAVVCLPRPPAESGAGARIFNAGEVDQRVVAMGDFWPADMSLPLQLRRDGRAALRVVVDEVGNVAAVETLASSLPVGAFIERLRHLQFKPAHEHGSAVRSELIVGIRLTLPNRLSAGGGAQGRGDEVPVVDEVRCVSWHRDGGDASAMSRGR